MKNVTKLLRSRRGFTLIELLTVVAIVGVLVAIAIPQFALYRQRGYDGTAQADLRNAASAQEANYVSTASYTSCNGGPDCQSKLAGYNWSAGVNMAMTAAADSFTGTASHSRGSGRVWSFDSTRGRIPE